MPPATTRPVRVFSQDERRLGLLTVRRRRLPAQGVHPSGAIQPIFAWFQVYGAVAPATGERFFLELPYLHADMCPLFVEGFAQAFPNSLNIWLWDNSGAHTAQHLRWPDHVQAVWLPPYGPELNPIERLWRDLKEALAWQQCVDLEAQQRDVAALLQAQDAPTRQTLTGQTYVLDAMYALCAQPSHISGLEEEHWGRGEAQRLGDLEVEDQLELHGLPDRQVGRIRPVYDFIHIGGGAPK